MNSNTTVTNEKLCNSSIFTANTKVSIHQTNKTETTYEEIIHFCSKTARFLQVSTMLHFS